METFDTPHLYTDRLILRALTPAVYKQVFTSLSDTQLMDFFGFDTDTQLAEERAKYEGGFTTHRQTMCFFQLIHKQTKRVIGGCGYHTWFPTHARAEMGYGLFRETDKRLGYMKEAIHPIIAYGFSEMGLNRIEALIGHENPASQRLVTALGFREEGVLREHYCKNGRIEDSIVFALLKSDYEQWAAAAAAKQSVLT